MKAIVLAILLFGLIHPMSKILLDSGIPLSFFCLSYVGIRLLAQAPLLMRSALFLGKAKKQPDHPPTKNHSTLTMLVTFGLVGAGLQFFEFKGIDKGLSPGTVTFIMFSYPIWLALVNFFSQQQKKISSLAAALFSALGVLLVTGGSLQEVQTQGSAIIYPFLASLFIALWIVLSGKLRNQGMKTVELSFFYDLFAFIVLLILFAQQPLQEFFQKNTLHQDISEFINWLSPANALYLALYSIGVGLLPNLLFYYGSKNVSSYTAGLAMGFEPVLSTLYSSMLWQHTFTPIFWVGASLITLANLPLEIISQKLLKNRNRFLMTLTDYK